MVGDILVSLCLSVRPSVRTSVRPACHVRSVTPTVLDGSFPYKAQMITSMRRCVTHNDLWHWPIFSRSFSHDFAIKLLKYGISCHVRSTASTVLDGFSPYFAQMITSMSGYVKHKDLWSGPISSRLFSHDFVIKLLKYCIYYRVQSTACTVLDGFSPYLALMITSMRGCVMQWPSTLRIRCITYNFSVNKSKVKVTQVIRIFAVGGVIS